MRIREICLLIFVGVFALLSLSYAQEDEHRKLAEELLRLTETDKNIERTFEMVKQMQMGQVNNIQLSEELSREDKEMIASMQGKIMDIIVKEMGWDNVKDDFIDIYVDVFTKDELEGIIAFYKTSAGQKFVKKQPELIQKSMEVSRKQMNRLMPKIQGIIQEMQKTIK